MEPPWVGLDCEIRQHFMILTPSRIFPEEYETVKRRVHTDHSRDPLFIRCIALFICMGTSVSLIYETEDKYKTLEMSCNFFNN